MYVRGARVERSPAHPLHQFVVAELHGTGYEDDGDVGVWLIEQVDERPAGLTSDTAPPIYAINALASSVSTLPSIPMPEETFAWLEDCTREMQRVVSGM